MVLVIGGCQSSPEDVPVRVHQACEGSTEEQLAAAAFIIECSEAANPKSDEEGEDLVAQCEKTAAKVMPKTSCFTVHQYHDYGWNDCNDAYQDHHIAACDALKGKALP